LVVEIKAVIDSLDPEGLHATGAPNDEWAVADCVRRVETCCGLVSRRTDE
jgi:hypothetical protein